MAWLADSLMVLEPSVSEKLCTPIYIIKEATVHEKASGGGARSTFARIAMDDYDVTRVLYQINKIRNSSLKYRILTVQVIEHILT